jgi:Dirigent-like protein
MYICMCDYIFDCSFKGSTLEVRGAWDPAASFEWAILGGTGQFTLAQGIIYGKLVRADTTNVMELNIRVFYRTLVKPAN